MWAVERWLVRRILAAIGNAPIALVLWNGEAIGAALAELQGLDPATIVRLRREKFMAIGRTLG